LRLPTVPVWTRVSASALRLTWPWLLVIGWSALQLLIARELYVQQRGPIDFLTYEIAAEKVARGESPYATVADDLATWRAYHRLEEQVRNPDTPEPLVRPGPYLYPPTLALLVAQTGIGPVGFAAVLVVSVVAFARMWLHATAMPRVGLLLVVLSWDIFAAVSGGNVELMLLAASMVAARLLWSAQWLLAIPFIAFVLLVKPFYVLFFATFVMMLLVARPLPGGPRLGQLGAAGVLTFLLVGFEVFRWGPDLRAEALAFMRGGIEHHWFLLPVGEQTPMSIWNRTLMQGFVNAGVSPAVAFAASLVLWCALAGMTVWRSSKQPVGFATTFALGFVLLYVVRPVGWTLNYLEFVVIGALWPVAGSRMRHVLIVGATIVMLSHWAALVLTAWRVNLWLFTLQTAELPWETWTLVPLCWILLVHHLLARRIPGVKGDRWKTPAS
jgi:hypothetical protein